MNDYNMKNKFEFLDPTKIKILDNNSIVEMGMSMHDVRKVLTPTPDTMRQTKIVFEDTNTEYISVTEWYNNMAIQIDYRDDKVLFFQIPNDSTLIFHNINLANVDYTHTLQLLSLENLKIRETDDNESIIDDLNLLFYHPYDNELETVCLFSPGYYLSDKDKTKYNVNFLRENGYDVIKYTVKKKNKMHYEQTITS